MRILAIFCLLGPTAIEAAEIPAAAFVAHLSPPAAVCGRTTRITYHGNHLGRPLDLWTSLPAGKVRARPVAANSPNAVTYDVQVALDAPVGVHGVRVATVDGLSNLVLLYVEDLPLRPMPANGGQAPGASSSQGTDAHGLPEKLTLPVALWGTFREGGIDRVAIDVAAGQKVGFEVVANRLGKDVDPLVTIRDARGRLVAEVDNSPGLYFDCRFEQVFTRAGTYTVELRESRYRGNEEGHFVLRMGKFPAGRVAIPSVVRAGGRAALRLPEIGDTVTVDVPKTQPLGPFMASVRRPGDDGSADIPLTVAAGHFTAFMPPAKPNPDEAVVPVADALTTFLLTQANPRMTGLWSVGRLAARLASGTIAQVPGVLCGVLERPGEEHVFWLRLQRGERIGITGEYRTLNSPLDLEIIVLDGTGRELARACDTAQDDPLFLEINVPADGFYGVRVRDMSRDGGPAYAYCLDVRRIRTQLQLVAEVEGLTVPQGSYQTVPLSLVRRNYTGPVALSLEGAPPGVTLSPEEIGEKETSVVCKLAAGPTAPLGTGTFRIWARPVLKLDTSAFGAATGVKLPAPVAEALAPRFPVSTKPLIDRAVHNVDLNPIALREDQRRLPPDLTDRFALQITPPAPFTLELPEHDVTLYRFCQVGFPVVTGRVAGFDGPIHFSARGGQIAPKNEGRTRVYAEFPVATPRQLTVTGTVHTRILVSLQKHRVDVTGVGEHQGRKVFLTRSFDLDVRVAFEVAADPPRTTLAPGAAAKLKMVAKRFAPFDGPVKIQLAPTNGLVYPEQVIIPKDRTSVDVPVTAPNGSMPGRHSIRLQASALVNGLEEETTGRPIEIEIVKPSVSKQRNSGPVAGRVVAADLQVCRG